MQSRFAGRLVVAAFSFLAFGALMPAAEPPTTGGKDSLDEARRRDQVAEQKAETDFRAALVELNKLENANPARAAERLKKVLSVLEEDTVLRPEKRAAWQRVLKDRIRIAEAGAERATKDAAENADHQATREERQAIREQKDREAEKLRQELEAVRRQGNTEDAARLAADLARRYPESPSATAASRITGVASIRRQYQLVKAEKEAGYTLSMLDVEKSSVLPKDPDFNFPSPEKWREITKKRSKTQMTEREKAILQALEAPVRVKFEGSTLESVIDYLQTLSGQTIILDKQTLEAAGISYDTPITVKAGPVSLRTVLRKVLGEVGLTYIVEKETIHVVTPKEAKERMTVRTYYLGDLAGVADVTLGPVFQQALMQQTVTNLIQTIVGTIEPDSWQVNNPEARGTIIYEPRSLNLIVKQSAEIHYMLGGFGR